VADRLPTVTLRAASGARPVPRWLPALLAVVAVVALLALAAPWLSGRAVLSIGPWRVSSRDPFRPVSVALFCIGLFGLIERRVAARGMWRGVSWGLIAAAVAITLATLLRGAPQGIATGDAAVAELYVLHAMRTAWPFGPYSQYFWHHPGPAMFYALAPLYGAAGQNPAALNLGAAFINIAAIAGGMWLAARRMPVLVSVSLAVTLAIWVARTASISTSYWNPHLILFPLLLFFWLAAAVCSGSSALIPVLAVAGSFLVQTHVGVTPVVFGLAALAIVMGRERASSQPDGTAPPSRRRVLNASAWLLLFLWALPFAEQVTGNPGNLTALAEFFWERRDSQQTLIGAANVWAFAMGGALVPQFRHPIGWAVSGALHPVALILAVVQVAGLLTAALRLRHHRSLARALGCAIVAELIALFAVLRVPGEVHDHAVFWIGILGTVGWGLLIGSVAMLAAPQLESLLRPRARLWQVSLTASVTALALVLSAVWFVRAQTGAGQHQGVAADVDTLYLAIVDALASRRVATPLVRIKSEVWSEAAGTLLQMYKRGQPFAVERRWLHMYGPPLAATGCFYSHTMRFMPVGSEGSGELIARAGAVEVRLEPTPACGPLEP
jgi:hypothetical protein